MKKIILSFMTLFAIMAVGASVAPAANARDCAGADKDTTACQALKGANKTTDDADKKKTVDGALKSVVNVLLFVIGGVSVIMIVVGGLRYVISNGESSAVSSAKNTILYAVVGLVIALFAYAIVNFVIKNF